MTNHADRFLVPGNADQRRYEALRARFVDNRPTAEVAERFGFSHGGFRNLCAAFMKSDDPDFLFPGRRKKRKPDPANRQRQMIVDLRKSQSLSIYDIAEVLKREGMPASPPHVHAVIRAAGLPRLPRRPVSRRRARPKVAPVADRRALDLTSRHFRTDFGGLFLFAHDLARLEFDAQLGDMPGGKMIPPGCAMRALLALKLWGIGRPSHIMPEVLDEGIALFAGLNAMPKRATLTEYSCRVDPSHLLTLMDRWHSAVHGLGVDLGGGRSFDLDFHTIPYHGDDALIRKHYVSKRSRRQKGILTFLARDADARMFAWANANVQKGTEEVFHFIDAWYARTGKRPCELVFDSRLTTYAGLAKLDAMGIDFITLRRRSQNMVNRLLARPREEWRRITLTNVGRAYRNPRVLEQDVRIKDYPRNIRQIAITGLGHEKPTLLITNQRTTSAAKLIDRYARRMIIENTIAEAIDFFHMDALSAAVPMKIDLDVQLTLMASALYRILAIRAGDPFTTAKPRTVFRHLVHASATVAITETEIVVTLGRRAHNPALIAAGYSTVATPLPWLGNRSLQIKFV